MADRPNHSFAPVLVTGAGGFLGRHLVPVLQQRYGEQAVVGVSSRDYDLMDPAAHRRMYEQIRPKVVVHLAAYSGGIGANRAYPADFYYRNTLLTALAFQLAAEFKVAKLVYPMGGCSYPSAAVSPIDESQMWQGYPQSESAGYSCAKKMGIVASISYRRQYGLKTSVMIPGNMYGEYDNYSRENSHVIPAMIRRYHEARHSGDAKVVMWGTGRPCRDFVYAGDVAATVPFFIEHYDSDEPVNVSTGTTTTIRELARSVKSAVGFAGNIEWDDTKPDGQMIKIFAVDRLKGLGLACPTPLDAGLEKTAKWFAANYDSRGDGLRL